MNDETTPNIGDHAPLQPPASAPVPVQRDLVPVPIKLAFGFAEYGLSLSANFLIFFLLPFVTTVAGLPASLASVVLLVGKIVDAVTDPMVGTLSDKTKSRWGRRLPFMVIGAPLLAVFFLAQLWVPDLSVNWLFIFYLLVGILSQTFYSVVTIPYTSLTAELTQDYEERTSLNSYRQMFSLGGSISSMLVALAVFNAISIPEGAAPDLVSSLQRQQYLVMGLVGAGIIAASVLVSVAVIKKYVLGREVLRLTNAEARQKHDVVQELSYLDQLRVAFSNRAFLILCLLYLFAWMAVQVTSTVLKFYLEFWMGLPPGQTPLVILAVTATALLLLAPWSMVSHRIGKKLTFVAGAVIWLVAQVMLLGVQPGQMGILITAAVLAGFGVSVCYLVPWSMLPDVIEYDELETGQRREGIFYGLIVFLQKLAVAAAIFFVGIVLDARGFAEKTPEGNPVTEQPESALLALRLLVGPLPMVFLVLAIIAALVFPITKEGHARTLEELRRRRGEHPPEADANNDGVIDDSLTSDDPPPPPAPVGA